IRYATRLPQRRAAGSTVAGDRYPELLRLGRHLLDDAGDWVHKGREGMTDVKTDVVLYEVRDGIPTLTLNRPDRLNAWTGGLARRYYSLLEDAAAEPDVRVIVVAGAGRRWGAGSTMNSPPAGRAS